MKRDWYNVHKKQFRLNFEQSLEGMVTLSVLRDYMTDVLMLLSMEQITLYHLESKKNKFYFTILLYDFKRVQFLLRQQRIRFHICKKRGVPFLISQCKRRKGIWIGLLCCVLLGNFFLSFLWAYEVTGNEHYSKEHVIALVQQYGLVQGRRINQFDFEQIEHEIELQHPEFTWIQLEAKGTTLCIAVKERLADTIDIQSSGSMVAKQEGQITELLVYTGTALVAEGEQVTKGQVLIGGWDYPNRIRNGMGEFVDVGTPYQVRAKGVVRAYTTHRAIASCALQENWLAKTGQIATCTELLWNEYHLFSIGETVAPYPYYNTEVTIKSLFQIGNRQCPIKIRTITYEEQIVMQRSFTPNEAYQTAVERARRQLQQTLKKDSVFVRESSGKHRTAEDGTVQAEVLWIVEEPIGEIRQLPLPNTAYAEENR